MFEHYENYELDVLVAMAIGLDVRPSCHQWQEEQLQEDIQREQGVQYAFPSGPDKPIVLLNGRVWPVPAFTTDVAIGSVFIQKLASKGLWPATVNVEADDLRKIIMTFLEMEFPEGKDLSKEFTDVLSIRKYIPELRRCQGII